jgi:hypothetical protein
MRRCATCCPLVWAVHSGERLLQVLQKLVKLPVERRRPSDYDIVEIRPCFHRREAADRFLQSPARAVAPNRPAALAPFRRILRDRVARDGEAKARALRAHGFGLRRCLQHESRRHPAPTGFQPDKVSPVFQCAQSRHDQPAMALGYAESSLRRRVRRRARIFCPAFVLMRARNPCLRLRRSLPGWKVRFTCLSP